MGIRKLIITATIVGLPATASAQDSVVKFQLAGAANNIQGCMAADTTLTRPVTVTVQGAVVTIKGAGGIDDKMKMTQPGVYTTTLAMGPNHIDFTAELGVTPKKLTAIHKSLGCRWNGTVVP